MADLSRPAGRCAQPHAAALRAIAQVYAVARLAHVSRARITHIMSLLLLAPDIQEAILFLPGTDGGRARIGERKVRPICAVADWRSQRRVWGD